MNTQVQKLCSRRRPKDPIQAQIFYFCVTFSLLHGKKNSSSYQSSQGLHYLRGVWSVATLKSSSILFVCQLFQLWPHGLDFLRWLMHYGKQEKILLSHRISIVGALASYLKRVQLRPTLIATVQHHTVSSKFKYHLVTNLRVLFYDRCVCGLPYGWNFNS